MMRSATVESNYTVSPDGRPRYTMVLNADGFLGEDDLVIAVGSAAIVLAVGDAYQLIQAIKFVAGIE